MSLLIKNAEIPMHCAMCGFHGAMGDPMISQHFCKVTGVNILNPYKDRLNNCPLIPVPEPHGRLIDADALVKDLKRQCEEVFKIDAVSPDDFWITRDQAYNEKLWKTWCESFFEYLKTRETIIQASEEGE